MNTYIHELNIRYFLLEFQYNSANKKLFVKPYTFFLFFICINKTFNTYIVSSSSKINRRIQIQWYYLLLKSFQFSKNGLHLSWEITDINHFPTFDRSRYYKPFWLSSRLACETLVITYLNFHTFRYHKCP